MDQAKSTIMLSGGGTGGSVTPLLAIAAALATREKNYRFVFVGSKTGPEKTLVAEAAQHWPLVFCSIPAGKWRRYFSWHNLFDFLKIAGAFFQALFIIKRFRPRVILSAGSFVSVPLVYAAKIWGVPILIHQLDVRPGLANKLMAPLADKISVTFTSSLAAYQAKAVLTGNPVFIPVLPSRLEIFKEFKLDVARPLVLIFGGATGAQALNEAVQVNLPALLALTQIIHISGVGKNIVAAQAGYCPLTFLPHEKILAIMAAADLIIARPGLGTITELSALEKASLLIPMPGTHQEDNAKVCQEAGAAVIIDQAQLSLQLVSIVKNLLADPAKRKSLAGQMAQLNPPAAAEKIADLIQGLIK
jgi:UDP-N-acetylglucosamine--N-acetylmuramyl-(pentapeptide) pyrophosphoryl-undecaprenol N-acetylglucosamine transferase